MKILCESVKGLCIQFRIIVILMALNFIWVNECFAQNLNPMVEVTLPRASQKATIIQRVGLTDLSITYSRPNVLGRKIWGSDGVGIPFGGVWRAGANENTIFSTPEDITVNGNKLPAGRYGLFIIPDSLNNWTVIFSKNSTSWGAFSYDEKEDALRVRVKVTDTEELEETLTYEFSNLKSDAAEVIMKWEKKKIGFTIKLDVHRTVLESIEKELRDLPGMSWLGYEKAAEYCLQNNLFEKANEYSDRAVAMNEIFQTLFTKSQILEKMGKKEERTMILNKAIKGGTSKELNRYAFFFLSGPENRKKAFELYQFALTKFPDEGISYYDMARWYRGEPKNKDNLQKIISYCQKAISKGLSSGAEQNAKKMDGRSAKRFEVSFNSG